MRLLPASRKLCNWLQAAASRHIMRSTCDERWHHNPDRRGERIGAFVVGDRTAARDGYDLCSILLHHGYALRICRALMHSSVRCPLSSTLVRYIADDRSLCSAAESIVLVEKHRVGIAGVPILDIAGCV